jgi:ferredoxin
VKVRINGDLCSGHGRCYTLAPDLIEMDDSGFAVPVNVDIGVPEGREDGANVIIVSCPEGAITAV